MFTADVHNVHEIRLVARRHRTAGLVTLRLSAQTGDDVAEFTAYSRALQFDRLDIAVAAFNAAMNHVPKDEPVSLEAVE